jgi:hypothetical protein
MALGLRFRHGRTGSFCASFELNANPFAINGLIVPVPGKTLYANRCNVAAETAKALQQRDTHASSSGSNRGGEPGGSTANNQDLGRMDNIHLSGGFTYFHLNILCT